MILRSNVLLKRPSKKSVSEFQALGWFIAFAAKVCVNRIGVSSTECSVRIGRLGWRDWPGLGCLRLGESHFRVGHGQQNPGAIKLQNPDDHEVGYGRACANF